MTAISQIEGSDHQHYVYLLNSPACSGMLGSREEHSAVLFAAYLYRFLSYHPQTANSGRGLPSPSHDEEGEEEEEEQEQEEDEEAEEEGRKTCTRFRTFARDSCALAYELRTRARKVDRWFSETVLRLVMLF